MWPVSFHFPMQTKKSVLQSLTEMLFCQLMLSILEVFNWVTSLRILTVMTLISASQASRWPRLWQQFQPSHNATLESAENKGGRVTVGRIQADKDDPFDHKVVHVYLRNECLFFFPGSWMTCLFCAPIHSPWTQKKRHYFFIFTMLPTKTLF